MELLKKMCLVGYVIFNGISTSISCPAVGAGIILR